MVHEGVEAGWEDGRHEVETVRCAGLEPVLGRIRHLLGGAGKRPVSAAAAEPADELAHRQLFLSGKIDDQGVPALRLFDLVLAGQVAGQLGIQGQRLRRDAPQYAGQLPPGMCGVDQRVQSQFPLPCFGLGGTENRHDARKLKYVPAWLTGWTRELSPQIPAGLVPDRDAVFPAVPEPRPGILPPARTAAHGPAGPANRRARL
jgi:hypothetical protein